MSGAVATGGRVQGAGKGGGEMNVSNGKILL
jgi:hypothetical protein